MSKFKFINIIDSIFLSVATFLIIFAWIQFFLKNFFLSLFVSSILATVTILIIKWFKSKKYTSAQLALANNSNVARFKLAIQTMPNSKLVAIIKKLIPSKYIVKTQKGDILFNKGNELNTFTFYYSNALNDSKLLELIKSKKTDKLVVFCSNFDKEAKLVSQAFKDIKVELINLDQLYSILNKNNISINTDNISLEQSKITLKDILKNSLSKNKSKGYFTSGLVLLFTSLIIPFKIYYVVISSILFALSLICRIKPTTSSINSSIFD